MTKAKRSRAERNAIAYFGGCPDCGDCDGYVNIGRSHWFLCDKHKVTWCVGSNLFSSWQHQTEDEQRKIYDQIGMGEYREIECAEAHTHPVVRRWKRDLDGIRCIEVQMHSLARINRGKGLDLN